MDGVNLQCNYKNQKNFRMDHSITRTEMDYEDVKGKHLFIGDDWFFLDFFKEKFLIIIYDIFY